jgi:hypothetical protein
MDTSGTLGIGVYLNNSYAFTFDSNCYFENQNYSVVLDGSSDENLFDSCRFANGGNRIGGVRLIGAACVQNRFTSCLMVSNNQTDANFVTDHADHSQNQILDCLGFNFISGSLVGVPYIRNNERNQSGGGMVIGGLNAPGVAVATDVGSGTSPGQIDGAGTGTATLYVQGFAEIGFDAGFAALSGSDTTITTINIGVMRNCFLLLRNNQATRKITIKNDGSGGPIALAARLNKTLTTQSDCALFWINSAGTLLEVGPPPKVGYSGAMVAGSVTVADTRVNSQTGVFVTRQPGGTNAGAHWCDTITPGTGFTVKSTNASDTGITMYEIR